MSTTVEQVLRLAARGWRLFPARARGKDPMVVDWPHQATSDEQCLRFWLKRFSGCNWGLVTGPDSGVFVLDVDGEEGEAALQEFVNRYGAEWTNTLIVKSARGAHLYFQYPDGIFVGNSASKLAPGLDVRGKGGYIIVPPSVHPSGHVYQWGDAGETVQIALAPEWLLELIATPIDAVKRAKEERGEPIPEGQRNSRLTSIGGALRRYGETCEGIEAALQGLNAARCRPPLAPAEVRSIARSVSRYQPALQKIGSRERTGTTLLLSSEPALLLPRFSEEALALSFAEQHAQDLRFVNGWGRWMCWDGMRWQEDSTLAVFDRVRALCRYASAECNGDQRAMIAGRLASAATVAAVERLARADRRLAATIDQWDADVWLLNTPAGTVDLRDGSLHEHRREQHLSKLTAASPGGDSPIWLKFLDQITAGDVDLQMYLQRVAGYCLTGSIREHAIFFLYGTGANGKSVFLSTIAGLLADYSKAAPAAAFTASNTEQHPTEVAGLRGARFVTAIETEEGRWWAEAKIKSLTGGDPIPARFMRQDYFQYIPQFKLIVAGNHKPGLRSVDESIRRRLHLIPFSVTISEQERDPNLIEKLRAEYPGILQWAIEGCLAWQSGGLRPPAVVRLATADYLAEEDAIGRWIEDRCCCTDRAAWTPGAELFSDWQNWCEQTGEREGTQKRLTQVLQARGFSQSRQGAKGTRGLLGIALRRALTHPTHESVSGVTRA